jgi:DNA (cytosine-5)-methyltransferase 1
MQKTFIDLFAGAGGFRLALQNIKAKCVFSSEIDPYACDTYQANFGTRPHGDITLPATKDAIPQKFDVLCGGFPCQPFSQAGKKLGFEDTRGTLFFHIATILEKHQPAIAFLENVGGLVTHEKGRTLARILETLDSLGYTTKYQKLNSMTHANIPQNRERVFLVCFHRDQVKAENIAKFEFPKPTTLTKKIADCLEPTADSKYFYTKSFKHFDMMDSAMKSTETLYQLRRVYVRQNQSNVCPCLTANMGTGGHNVPVLRTTDGQIRKLTPRECFSLQGFPTDFVLPTKNFRGRAMSNARLYKQAGNSVTVPLIQKIAESFIDLV